MFGVPGPGASIAYGYAVRHGLKTRNLQVRMRLRASSASPSVSEHADKCAVGCRAVCTHTRKERLQDKHEMLVLVAVYVAVMLRRLNEHFVSSRERILVSDHAHFPRRLGREGEHGAFRVSFVAGTERALGAGDLRQRTVTSRGHGLPMRGNEHRCSGERVVASVHGQLHFGSVALS